MEAIVKKTTLTTGAVDCPLGGAQARLTGSEMIAANDQLAATPEHEELHCR